MRKLLSTLSLFGFIFLLFQCKKDPANPPEVPASQIVAEQNQRLSQVLSGQTASTFLSGVIEDERGKPLEGVEVRAGDKTAMTNASGRFVLGKIQLHAQYAVIKASKSGFFDGVRTFTPTKGAFNTARIQLLEEGAPQEVSALEGGALTLDDDIELAFPAEGISKANGEAYTGTVNVYARYISPEASNFTEIMPGVLAGLGEDNEMNSLVSEGMMTVELRDKAQNELQIASGKMVDVCMPASSIGPDTIPLWHFNEKYGVWVESGKAVKKGNKYCGQVNHFSSWNLDFKVDAVSKVDVRLTDNANNSIANQRIDIIHTETGRRLRYVYTDDAGKFTLLNAPYLLTFRVLFDCDSVDVAKDMRNGNVELKVSPNPPSGIGIYTLHGQINDCQAGEEVNYAGGYFTLQSTDGTGINLGGVTNSQGRYSLSSVGCGLSLNTPYEVRAQIVSAQGTSFKDTTFTLELDNTNQELNINYCGVSEGVLDDAFVIPFLNIGIERETRKIINKSTGAITYGDVKEIKKLTLYQFSGFSGIQYYHGLDSIVVVEAQVDTLSYVTDLKQLKLLDLSHTYINYLTSLCDFGTAYQGKIVLNNTFGLDSLKVSSLRNCLPNATIDYSSSLSDSTLPASFPINE